MFKEKNKLALLSLLAFVLAPIISTQETASPEMPLVLVAMCPAFIAIISKSSSFKDRGYILPTSLFFLSACLSTLISPYSDVDVRLIKYLVFASYFILIISVSFTENNLLVLFRCYIFASFILAILIILSYIYGYSHVDSLFYQGRYSIGITGLYKNPNYITSFINMGYYLVIFELINGTRKAFYRALYIVLLLLFLVAMYFSGTRAALLTALTSTSLVFLFSSSLKKTGQYLLFFIIVAVVASFFLVDVSFLIDNFLGHRGSLEDTGRTETWIFALLKLVESPIWGYGLFGWDNIPGADLFMGHLHNIYIDMMISQGLIGILFFIFIYFKGTSKIRKEDRPFVYIFMFVNSFPLMFQNGFVEANFWRFMILNAVVINYSICSKGGFVSLFRR